MATSLVGDDPAFAGYSSLGPEEITEGGVTRALGGLWRDMAEVLAGARATPRCTLEDGLAALRVVEATRRAAATGQTVAISTGDER